MIERMSGLDADMREAMRRLATEKADRLTSGGKFEDLVKELRDHHHLPLVTSREEQKRLRDLGEPRNLIIHQNGVVTARYKRRVPEDRHEIGERIALTRDGVRADLTFLSDNVIEVATAAMLQLSALPQD